ncbi:MAG: 16S rRNA (adenine(1518)-N(6)/adenine(1519)-N(6))-dimethyltransferase RsmA [Alphaproteobacteria bacterium]|tara:strand:+ start:4821 stop:5594 length:774 start_codon:yes stop_codon:yes gene_type:complete
MFNFRPKKKFGQNFLKNKDLLKKISELKDFENKLVLEIGPGTGALTEYLLKKQPKKLIAIEKDEELKPFLLKIQKKYLVNFEIIFQDALRYEYSKFEGKKIFLVANLPFHIATTLVIKWLKYIENFESIIIMVQKEVAERLSAKVSTKFYGRTSILVQLHSNVTKIFDVSPENFHPKPKVNSSVIELSPKSNLNFNYERVDKLLKICFAQRRKKLKNNLNKISYSNLEKIIKSGIDLNLRPQDISIENYVMMSKLLI